MADATELTEFERAVLGMMLAGDDPRLEALRRQLAGCRVRSRELTGVGFYTWLAVLPGVEPASVSAGRATLGDVEATVRGLEHGAGFVLFVTNGMLDNLEGFTYDEPWPETIEGFSLRYLHQQRDLTGLGSGDSPA